MNIANTIIKLLFSMEYRKCNGAYSLGGHKREKLLFIGLELQTL